MTIETTAKVTEFSEALEWFLSKTPVTQEQADQLEDVARARAFTLAGALEIEAVQTVFDELASSLAKGTPLEDFKKAVEEKLIGKMGPDGHHLETVFVNNCQQAYNSGRWVQMNDPAINALRPFRMFDAVLDDHTCFAAGTPVRMADGTDRAIELVRPGDEVLSARGRARRVVATMVTPKRTWGVLQTACGKTLRVTPNHPILTARGWIRARLLVPGDAVVVATENLPHMWLDLPVDSQRGRVLLDQVPPEAGYATASVRELRQDVHAAGQGRNAQVLQQELQVGCEASASDVQGVRQTVSARVPRSSPQILLEAVQPRRQGLRVVLQGVQLPKGLRRARAVPLLHPSLQGRASSEELPRRHRCSQDVRAVRLGLQGAASGSAGQPILFKGMSAQSASAVLGVRRTVRQRNEERPALLLGRLLSQAHRRDRARSGGAVGLGEERYQLRAGSACRPLVHRLPDREPDLLGGGRRFLARRSEDPCSGRAPGRGTDEARVHGDPRLRTGCQERSGVRDSRALRLCPVPSGAIEAAPTAVVSAIHWELTDQSEPAYDIEVEEDHGFVANGIVVHNSDVCRACDGVVRAWDDAFWATHSPALHHRCRSQIRSLRPKEAARRGLTETLPEEQASEGFGLPPNLRNDGVLRPKVENFDPEVWQVFESREFKAAFDLELEKERVREAREKRDQDNDDS